MTNRKNVVRKWLGLSVAIIVLIGLGLALNHGYFQNLLAQVTQNKAVLPGGLESAGATEKTVQGLSSSGFTSTRVPRTPAMIGDPFEAFGKPADVEVCGFGVQHVKEFPMGISLPLITASNETLNKAARDLANSKIDTERALGLYLQAKLAGDAALERAQLQEPGCSYARSENPSNKSCSADFRAARQSARMDAVKPLIEMAQTSTNPNVYATAYYFCEDVPRDARGACAPISAAGWARIDAENIFPQLLARSPGPFAGGTLRFPPDNPSDDLPLSGTRYDRRSLRFDQVMSQDIFKQEPLYMQMVITQWLTFELFLPDSGAIRSIYGFCRPAEISRASRSQACGQIADLMDRDGKTYLELSTAIKFGADGRLPDAQVEKLKAEQTNYYSRAAQIGSGVGGYSCEGMAIQMQHFADIFARGERAVMAEVDAIKP